MCGKPITNYAHKTTMKTLQTHIKIVLSLLCLFVGHGSASAIAKKYLFSHMPTTTSSVHSICQDRDGFLWYGTTEGLYRYLGEGVIDNSVLFAGNYVDNIQQDSEGRLWLKSRNNVVIYDPRTHRTTTREEVAEMLGASKPIEHFHIDSSGGKWWIDEQRVMVLINSESESVVASVLAEEEEVYALASCGRRLYLLTRDGVVHSYGYDTSGVLFRRETLRVPSPVEIAPTALYVDSKERVWVADGSRGAWSYNPKSGSWQLFSEHSPNNRIISGSVLAFVEDASGSIWISTDHGGISVYNPSTGHIENLRHDPMDDYSLASNSVYTLYCDRDENIWIGYYKKGLSLWQGESSFSVHHLQSLRRKLVNDDINAICEDSNGNLWFGTDGHGLVRVNARNSKEELFTHANSALGSNVITDLYCDSRGRVWICTYYGGISCYENGRLRTYNTSNSALEVNDIWSVGEDADGNIWIGTLGGGLVRLDPQTDRMKSYSWENSRLANDYIIELDCGQDDKIYMATAYGLSIFDINTERAESIMSSADGAVRLMDDNLLSVCHDSRGLVWMTGGRVLEMYDPESGQLYNLPQLDIHNLRALLEDDKGNVWAVGDGTICRVRAERVKTDNAEGYDYHFDEYVYRYGAGLDGTNQRAVSLLESGDVLIGGFNGYMRFSPDAFAASLTDSQHPFFFTSLRINNTPIEVGQRYAGREILSCAIEYTERIELSHNQNLISIDFTSLDYASLFGQEVVYRLEGMSKEWITIDRPSQTLTFLRLPTGVYRLHLAYRPVNGEPTPCHTLEIVVLPPLWLSWWAIVFYVVLFFLVIYVVVLGVHRRRRRKMEMMQMTMQYEKQRDIDQMKLRFFTNVSHDFRTPLTLIITPVEEMLRREPEGRDSVALNTIYRNAKRLLSLVNQILDLRKLDVYGMRLTLSSGDIVALLREVSESFALLAENRKITLAVKSSEECLMMQFDRDKIVKVIMNLLDNAFKFTPNGGVIELRVSRRDERTLLVGVADSGCGIPQREKGRIFERFYQTTPDSVTSGSGIGLHLSKEFVTMHGGQMRVEDNKPQGTVISFTLPIRACEVPILEATPEEIHEEEKLEVGECGARPRLLLVDDNDDFREFMTASLMSEYDVVSAANGRDAMEIVEREDVDIIVCDVMMPIMDGRELCRRIKSHINTSHIPVILLTARTMQEDERVGLESGADDYITKPFNLAILKLRIHKFLEWKERSHSLFASSLEIEPEQITITSMDDRLLQSAMDAVNENISNPEFSVADLSSILGMHRTHLYKKLHHLTGKSPLEFIRTMRLKRAAQLLEKSQMYVSEVAYMVGFNSPKIFAKHFREEFGVSPSQYQRKTENRSPKVEDDEEEL